MSFSPSTFSPLNLAGPCRAEPRSWRSRAGREAAFSAAAVRPAAVSRAAVSSDDTSTIAPSVARSSDNSAAAAAPPSAMLLPSLAMLLAGHILHDGEVVLLILKPSRWSILFATMPFAAVVAIGAIAGKLCVEPRNQHVIIEAAGFALACRVMWATLQWMGRLYVMTDYRILRLAGVFNVDLFDCPLRKVKQTRLVSSVRERLWGLGSIEIQPVPSSCGDPRPPGIWQAVRRPTEVHDQIRAAIARARSGGA